MERVADQIDNFTDAFVFKSVAYGYLQQTTSADDIFRCIFCWRFKEIEILAIILVPLIMTLSRGHTGQIKGQS